MVILHQKIQPGLAPIATAVMELLDSRSRRFRRELSKGWRCIVKVKDRAYLEDGSIREDTLLHLDLQQGDEGDWAEAKMSSLEKFEDLIFTSPENIAILIEGEEIELGGGIEVTDELTEEVMDAMMEAGIAPFYGGIRILYDAHAIPKFCDGRCPCDDEPQTFTHHEGELLIAFDGSTEEWLDVFMSLSVFAHLDRARPDLLPQATVSYQELELLRDSDPTSISMILLGLDDLV